MNKNTTYLVLILLALVLFSGYADGITGLASLRCVDKDRLDTSRKTCIKLAGKGTWCDSCVDINTVSEVRCISGNRRDRKNIACAEGYECQDGACVFKQIQNITLMNYQ